MAPAHAEALQACTNCHTAFPLSQGPQAPPSTPPLHIRQLRLRAKGCSRAGGSGDGLWEGAQGQSAYPPKILPLAFPGLPSRPPLPFPSACCCQSPSPPDPKPRHSNRAYVTPPSSPAYAVWPLVLVDARAEPLLQARSTCEVHGIMGLRRDFNLMCGAARPAGSRKAMHLHRLIPCSVRAQLQVPQPCTCRRSRGWRRSKHRKEQAGRQAGKLNRSSWRKPGQAGRQQSWCRPPPQQHEKEMLQQAGGAPCHMWVQNWVAANRFHE